MEQDKTNGIFGPFLGRRRAANAISYGLILGMVSIAALAVIQATGSAITDLFDEVAAELPGAAGSGDSQPGASAGCPAGAVIAVNEQTYSHGLLSHQQSITVEGIEVVGDPGVSGVTGVIAYREDVTLTCEDGTVVAEQPVLVATQCDTATHSGPSEGRCTLLPPPINVAPSFDQTSPVLVVDPNAPFLVASGTGADNDLHTAALSDPALSTVSPAGGLAELLAASDPDIGDSLTWSVVTPPIYGTLQGLDTPVVAAAGNGVEPLGVSYTPHPRDPNAGFFGAVAGGADSFVIQVSDGFAPPVQLTVTVQGPGPADCPNFGDVCADGTVYGGQTHTGDDFFVSRCDIGMAWDGNNCTGSRSYHNWNSSGSTDIAGIANYSRADLVSSDPDLLDGRQNTTDLVNGGIAADDGAAVCDALGDVDGHEANAHGHDDWYLPAYSELVMIYSNLIASDDGGSPQQYVYVSPNQYNVVPNGSVGPQRSTFNTDPNNSPTYLSSSEHNAPYAHFLFASTGEMSGNGTVESVNKNQKNAVGGSRPRIGHVRCVRRR